MISREWQRLDASTRETITAHQVDLPIKVSSIAKGLGVKLVASTLPVGISGEIRPDSQGRGFVIKINRHDAPRRQRFTAAHELAHFLLHKDDIGNGITDDVLYRSSLSDRREAEANRLAADLLMPQHLIDRELESARDQGSLDVVERLAERFEVSESAMRIRLGMAN